MSPSCSAVASSSDPDANGDVHPTTLRAASEFDRSRLHRRSVTEPTSRGGEPSRTLEAPARRGRRPAPTCSATASSPSGSGTDGGLTPSTPTSMRSRRPAGDRLPAAGRFRRPLEEARTDSVEMSCDTCKLQGRPRGLRGRRRARAMLRALASGGSRRPREDIDDEPHSHDAPEKHVAVCTNQTCAKMGSPSSACARKSGIPRTVTPVSPLLVSPTAATGPMVAVYPDGIWVRRRRRRRRRTNRGRPPRRGRIAATSSIRRCNRTDRRNQHFTISNQ